jgi:hypothetical protein
VSYQSREHYLSALSSLLTGGLITDTSDNETLSPEAALCHCSGALLKAVLVATFHSGVDPQFGPGGWASEKDALTPVEEYAALSMIVELLQNGPGLIQALRARGELRETWERAEHVEAARGKQPEVTP